MDGAPLTLSEPAYWFALVRAPSLNYGTLTRLIREYSELKSIFKAPKQDLKALGLKQGLIEYLRSPDWTRIDADLKQ